MMGNLMHSKTRSRHCIFEGLGLILRDKPKMAYSRNLPKMARQQCTHGIDTTIQPENPKSSNIDVMS